MIRAITQTMLATASRCGEQFRRRWMEWEIIPPGVAAIRGSSVHKAASQNHGHIRDTGETLSKQDIQDAAASAFNALVSEGVSMTREEASQSRAVIGKAKDTTVNLAGLYSDDVVPTISKPAMVEETLEADFGLLLPLSGTIDLLHDTDEIVDLKTASVRKPVGWEANNIQAIQYTMLVRNARGVMPRVRFPILVDTKVPAVQTVNALVSEDDFTVLEARAMSLVRMIQSGVFPPANPESWNCSPRWCGYYSTCPYVRMPVSTTVEETIE